VEKRKFLTLPDSNSVASFMRDINSPLIRHPLLGFLTYIVLRGEIISLTLYPRSGGPGALFLSGPYPSISLAWVTLLGVTLPLA
jgi:hypothetical protein